MNLVFCASEVFPFAKTGGLADVTGALPLALEKLGEEVAIVMPFYQCVQEGKFDFRRTEQGVNYVVIGKNIKVYFVANDAYFKRNWLYGTAHGDFGDNLDRFAYFCQKALEIIKETGLSPDIIHCHDWQTGLIPAYLKTKLATDRFYKHTKSLITIHNLGYQGLFEKGQFWMTGLEAKYFNQEEFEFYDRINLLKGGIAFSDIINTVSPTYSRQIQSKELGFGLEGVLRKRQQDVYGILNGLDYSIWDPAKDNLIAARYSLDRLIGKPEDKKDLQKTCKLPVNENIPILGVVSRLAEQKGIDLLTASLGRICKKNLQLVILGTGDLKYHKLLQQLAAKFHKNFALLLKFDEALAHKIYAGSDIFLMPSQYEPCGLGQLISLKYGSLPLVFKTGGLADTVNNSNGFVFEKYSSQAFLETIGQALKLFAQPDKWRGLQKNAMLADFSWETSAKGYIHLYEKAKKS